MMRFLLRSSVLRARPGKHPAPIADLRSPRRGSGGWLPTVPILRLFLSFLCTVGTTFVLQFATRQELPIRVVGGSTIDGITKMHWQKRPLIELRLLGNLDLHWPAYVFITVGQRGSTSVVLASDCSVFDGHPRARRSACPTGSP